jgi:hypothetical protein
VTPFHLNTTDGETLFCWHVLPLDVYLENESELVQKATGLVEDLKDTVGAKLLRMDPLSKVVVNSHGVSGFLCTCLSASSSCFPLSFYYRWSSYPRISISRN